ncbi:unnamed protein product, partial [Brenthis ino]
MAKDLKNKIVLVTGGAVGIGFDIADKFLQKGAKLAILADINEEQGTKSATKLCVKYGENRAVFIKCNVTKDMELVFKKIVDTYKTVDVLVNNAGVLNDLDAKKTIDINVLALIEWSIKFWEHMRTDKGGKGGTIINISSIYGYRVDQFLPVYQASKFAVLGFTKSLGHTYNFNRTGVRVVAICPGFTKTQLVENPKINWDKCVEKDFLEFLSTQLWQNVDSVSNAAVEVFQKADSGTAWRIEGAQPIAEVL